MEPALSAVRFFAALRMTWGEGLAITDGTMLQLPSIEGMDSRLRGNDGVMSLLRKHMPSPFRHMSLLRKHMPPLFRHMSLLRKHMPPPFRHMSLLRKHMPPLFRHMSLLRKHMPPPFRHMSLLRKQESRQYNRSTLVSQETLKWARQVRRRGAC
jgi:hypothetical protein